jgi:hypothetical protein
MTPDSQLCHICDTYVQSNYIHPYHFLGIPAEGAKSKLELWICGICARNIRSQLTDHELRDLGKSE